ncbi:MAG: hypothetical protein F4171_17330, partial [Gammaproteobacteria bacterium]|nr:hypothetical protein [Gammaproteobacteria bacterium]
MRLLVLALALLTAACGTESTPDTTPPAETIPEPAEAIPAPEPAAADRCTAMGPPTPRDIASAMGLNSEAFPL